jgi:Zn-finger nucleic acid-binding protein
VVTRRLVTGDLTVTGQLPILARMTTNSAGATSLSCPGCGAAASPSDAACAYCDRVLSSVACDNCFARLFEGMKYCPHCGGPGNFGQVNHEAETLACPGCGDQHCTSALVQRRVGDQTLHECLACHGLWLPAHVVDAIVTDANARALFAPDAVHGAAVAATRTATASKHLSAFRYRRCPACAKMMSRVNLAKISGVIVDRCSQHGTFFDLDELHALVRFLEQGGLDRARAREREALADERRRLQMLMDIDARRRSMEYSGTDGVPVTSVTSLLTALLRRPGA